MKIKNSVKLLFCLSIPLIFISCLMDWDVQKVMYSSDYYPPTPSRNIRIFSADTLKILSQEYIEIAEVVINYCEWGEEGPIKELFIQKAKEAAGSLGGDGFIIKNWVFDPEDCPQRMSGLVVKFTSQNK